MQNSRDVSNLGYVLFWNFFSAYLCVPLRLCAKCARTTCLPQSRRGTQRYAEKIRHHRNLFGLGWNDAGKSGTKEECLAYIKEVWTDMRPLSLRKKMEEQAQGHDS